ncbi:hypothetical protein M758_UG236100 [Ceratodon purpureus]|nr:hypothetical protein M758_UG236100 [Ceratodon purpureus]
MQDCQDPSKSDVVAASSIAANAASVSSYESPHPRWSSLEPVYASESLALSVSSRTSPWTEDSLGLCMCSAAIPIPLSPSWRSPVESCAAVECTDSACTWIPGGASGVGMDSSSLLCGSTAASSLANV